MSQIAIHLGPQDDGRRMTLDEFDQAEGQSGYLYELGRGVISVIDVPKRRHLAQVTAVRRQFAAFDLAHAGCIHTLAGGGECKILVASLQSERHPDLAVYKTPPGEDEDLWSTWIPELVIEVVSPGSEHRDYVEKRDDYLAFGVQEYWIIDAQRQQMLVLRRSGGAWVERTLGPQDVYRTRLLPGFEFDLSTVLTID